MLISVCGKNDLKSRENRDGRVTVNRHIFFMALATCFLIGGLYIFEIYMYKENQKAPEETQFNNPI